MEENEANEQRELLEELAILRKRIAEIETNLQGQQSADILAGTLLQVWTAGHEQAPETAHEIAELISNVVSESIPFGVWISNFDGSVIYLSESFLQLLGMTLDECQDFGWMKRLSTEDKVRIPALWKKCVKTGCLWNEEYRITGGDGKDHYVQSRGVPVLDAQGGIMYWAGLNLDTTERRQEEERLKNVVGELDSFTQTVSHDLRSPLATLDLYAQTARTAGRGGLDGTEQHMLDEMRAVVQRTTDLVEALLDYANSGRAEGNLESVKPNAILTEVLANLSAHIQARDAEIIVDENMPVIIADRFKLDQVFSNLIENALKAGVEGRPLKLEIGAKTEGDRITLYVRDNGPGIANDQHEEIFLPFRGTSGLSKSGIGLSIVRRSVEGWGGRVWVESRLGEGSTFFFTAPAAT